MGNALDVHALAALVETRDDDSTVRAASMDSGRILARKPRAVAAPRAARDVVEIVRWANRTGSPVALRGTGHTQAGQSLTDGGVQIDMQGVGRIGPVDEGRQSVRVQAGATWRDVVGYVRQRGWMPMVLTNNLDSTVGGTLSTGGVGQSSHLYGTQANNVDELEAVTGDGRLLRCSATENAYLFDATRAGLGQFSVITEARIRIRRVRPRVRTFRLVYDDLETLMRDQAHILSRRRFHYLIAWCRHRGQRFMAEDDDWPVAGDWSYPMEASVEFDAEPDEAELLAGLHHRRLVRTVDRDIVEHADLPDPMPLPAVRYAATALSVPVTEAYLPWAAAAACVTRLLEALPPPLLASTSVVVRPLGLEPTPMLMLPRTGPVLGFGLFPYIPSAVLQSVLPVIENAGRLLVAAGGKRYLTGWVRRDHDEWRAHYGQLWTEILRWKETFDPNGILSNGFIRFGPAHDMRRQWCDTRNHDA